MIRAILDANVVASGAVGYERDESTPGAILRSWFARSFELLTSDPLIDRRDRTDARTTLRHQARSPRVYDLTVPALHEQATRVAITVTVAGVATHPADDLILAAAVSAWASHLVTGDIKLQRLGADEGVTILSPRDVYHFGAARNRRLSQCRTFLPAEPSPRRGRCWRTPTVRTRSRSAARLGRVALRSSAPGAGGG